jgi:hypothetical protein
MNPVDMKKTVCEKSVPFILMPYRIGIELHPVKHRSVKECPDGNNRGNKDE